MHVTTDIPQTCGDISAGGGGHSFWSSVWKARPSIPMIMKTFAVAMCFLSLARVTNAFTPSGNRCWPCAKHCDPGEDPASGSGGVLLTVEVLTHLSAMLFLGCLTSGRFRPGRTYCT